MPDTIQFSSGSQSIYTYAANGVKQKIVYKTSPEDMNLPVTSLDQVLQTVSNAKITSTDYCGNYIYENDTLKMILTPEGYIQNGVYYYYLKDHLGSNRVVLRQDGAIVERDKYYPSGARFGESVLNRGNVQPYRHIGMEMQSMHGLNWIDNGARMRTVGLPAFTTMDPLAEKYYGVSPYAYCAGNPVKYLDPNGGRLVDATGNITYTQFGGWTKYASVGDKRIGNDMMRTKTGTKQWNKMANAPYPITTTLSSEDKTVDKGNGIKVRHFGDSFVSAAIDNEKINVLKVDFVVYEGTIKTDIKDHPNQKLTIDDKIAIFGGHESVHSTDKTNIAQGVTNEKAKKEIYDIEVIPNKVEQQIQKEIELQKPPELLPVPIVGIK